MTLSGTQKSILRAAGTDFIDSRVIAKKLGLTGTCIRRNANEMIEAGLIEKDTQAYKTAPYRIKLVKQIGGLVEQVKPNFSRVLFGTKY